MDDEKGCSRFGVPGEDSKAVIGKGADELDTDIESSLLFESPFSIIWIMSLSKKDELEAPIGGYTFVLVEPLELILVKS